MRISALALLAILVLLPFASSANGDIVFEDNFNTNGVLAGQLPGIGGIWTQTGTSATNPINVVANAAALVNTGQDVWGGFTLGVPTTPGAAIYSGLAINVSAATAAGDYFFHLSDPAGTTTNFYQRLYARSSGAGFQLGLASFSGTGTVITYGTGELSFNQSYRVVTSWDFVSGLANDVFNVYVDPTDPNQSGNTAYISGYGWTGSAEPTTQLSAVNFRQGGTTTFPTLAADNLTIATTFAEAARLTAIPEPGTAGLAMLALTGLVGLVRRRTV